MSVYSKYNLTPIQEEIIESMVDEHNWLINRVPDDDERFSAIYIQADDMAKELKMDREEFWTIFFPYYIIIPSPLWFFNRLTYCSKKS